MIILYESPPSHLTAPTLYTTYPSFFHSPHFKAFYQVPLALPPDSQSTIFIQHTNRPSSSNSHDKLACTDKTEIVLAIIAASFERIIILTGDPPLSAVGWWWWWWWGGVELPNFQKRGLDRTSIFRGGLLGKRRVTLFRGVAIFT